MKIFNVLLGSISTKVRVEKVSANNFKFDLGTNSVYIDFDIKSLRSGFSLAMTKSLLESFKTKNKELSCYSMPLYGVKNLDISMKTKEGEPIFAYYYILKEPWTFKKI